MPVKKTKGGYIEQLDKPNTGKYDTVYYEFSDDGSETINEKIENYIR